MKKEEVEIVIRNAIFACVSDRLANYGKEDYAHSDILEVMLAQMDRLNPIIPPYVVATTDEIMSSIETILNKEG